MKEDILQAVIKLLEKNEILVLGIACDFNGVNRLMKPMHVDFNKPSFTTDSGRDILVFSDTTHLLKCVKNRDSGFVQENSME